MLGWLFGNIKKIEPESFEEWYRKIDISQQDLIMLGELCNDGFKVKAVTTYRDLTNRGLKDAMDFIEQLNMFWPSIKAIKLDESNNGYYLWDTVENFGEGPYTELQIKQLLKDGRISLESRIKQGKDSKPYQSILSFLEFQSGYEDFI
jgi:hypothetical protein